MPDHSQVSQGGAGKSRVFFALWPDARVRERLAAEARNLQRRLGGRATRPDTLHLTLLFIGDVDDSRLAGLIRAAERVESPGFVMCLDHAHCWRHNHIAYRGIRHPPAQLTDLVRLLAEQVERVGVGFDAKPFKPHVTLVRKADCDGFDDSGNVETESPASDSVFWSARDFVLVKSSLRPDGARYEQLGRWPLP